LINGLNGVQRRADSLAERARRDSEQMQQDLDRRLASSSPNMSSPNFYQRVPICSSCRKQVSEAEAKGSSCPHCGARWAFNQYDTSATNRTTSSPLASLSGSGTQRAVRSTILIVGALVVVVVLCGGAIAVAMAIASASRPKRQYRI
jgi:predicted RNA-binding Zn-ribbon protein involved in translation (DUF1610 family)